MNIKELEDKYLGKRVSYPWKSKGFGSEEANPTGVCEFIGYNPYLPEWGLQVTINRMPIQNIDLDKLKLIDNGKQIKFNKD